MHTARTLRRRTVAFAAAVTLLVAALGVARRIDSPLGLRATYFPTANWGSPPARSLIDRQPSTGAIAAAWSGDAPVAFSATWTGSFIVFRDATYTFASTSDDGSWIYVDGVLVVDNGGGHEVRSTLGTVHLTRGVHALLVNYFQNGGSFELSVDWGRSGLPLEPMPEWRLRPKQPSFARFLLSAALERTLAAAEWLWVAVLVAAVVLLAWAPLAVVLATVRRDPACRALAVVIAISIVLNVIGIWCGLTDHTGWFGDETDPLEVFAALSRRFSHGWWSAYPPVHYYTLAAVYSPLLLLDSLGRVDTSSGAAYDALFLAGRLVSVAAGIGTLIAIYVCGARAFSKRAGVLAAAAFALVMPFICYAKVANVILPNAFWCALSMVFYIRLLDTPSVRDMVMFAASATVAVCTKDQAYALYLTAPFAMAYAFSRGDRAGGRFTSLIRAFLDRRMLAAAVTGLLLFAVAQNFAFNFTGFAAHVRFITGAGSHNERTFAPTLAGQLGILALTAQLDERSWGWPLFLVSIAGFGVALASPRSRRAAMLLSLPVVSTVFGFICVVLYVYDRFLLPVLPIQALFAGVALDCWLGGADRGLVWRRLAAAGLLGYSLLYAATADVLMVRDSRYVVERWLRDHVGADQTIGTVFPPRNRPALDGLRVEDIGTIDGLRERAPAFYVLDADYARAVPADSPTYALIAGLQHESLGYALAFKYRAPPPWPWLPGAHPDLVGPRLDARVVSTVRDINPTFEVYRAIAK